jgi:hypothetical protein
MHKQRIDKSKRPYARKASAWRALIRRAEDGTALSIKRGQNKQRERKLFSDKSFNKHFVQRDGRDGLDWQLGDSLDGGGGCGNGRVIQGWRLREIVCTGEVSAAHPTMDSIEATERA